MSVSQRHRGTVFGALTGRPGWSSLRTTGRSSRNAAVSTTATPAFILFAPGLIGAGIIANLSRAMLAIGRLKAAAAGVAGSFLCIIVAQVVLVAVVPPGLVVPALALGNTIGMTGAAIPLLIVTRPIRGANAVAGIAPSAGRPRRCG